MIKTERLVIKPYEDSDCEGMVRLLTDETISQTFMLPDFQSQEEAAAMFKRLLDYSCSDDHYERGIYKDNELIGFVNDVEIKARRIEIGYVIHPGHHGRGYATEALGAVIPDLFQKGYEEVAAATFADNAASRRVMEKCGMRLIEKTDDVQYRGGLHRCVFYSIKREPQINVCP
ncbi:MAG: GNAT family N-acetyltransferase [Clostridia bacterium]|nr:GNAT family N-acetyltransferase [Clostridia bacterium]